METNKIKLTKDEMKEIFNTLMLYYGSSSVYYSYSVENLKKVILLYYDSLKYYSYNAISLKMRKHIEKSNFFPKIGELIPTENEMRIADER